MKQNKGVRVEVDNGGGFTVRLSPDNIRDQKVLMGMVKTLTAGSQDQLCNQLIELLSLLEKALED